MNRTIPCYSSTWLLLIAGLLAVVVYFPGLAGDYMFDDRGNVLGNQQLDMAVLDLESIQSAAFSSGSGMLRRPVSMASFALNRYFFGIDPYSYKVTNLVIHLVTGLFLFLLARRMVRCCNQAHGPGLSPAAQYWLPVIVSGLWLVHPLNLSPVLYIVQRMASLAALFTAIGLYLYVVGRCRMREGRHGWVFILTGLLVFGGLATFSKENGALLPLYMLITELALFRFRDNTGQRDKPVLVFFTVIVAIPALLVLLLLAMEPAALINYSSREFTLAERVLTEARVLVFYLKMIIMPSIQELGLYHDDIPLSRGLLDPPTTLYALAFLATLFTAALLLLKRQPLIGLGILWFFTGHALESTVIALEITHEHRNYLADFGILLAAATALAQAPLRRLAPVIHTAIPLLFLVMYSYTTWLRSTQWSDNINQAIYEARHHPKSLRSVFAAGRIHARLALQGHPGSADQAFAYLERASQLDRRGIMPEVTRIKLNYLLDRQVDPILFETILNKLGRHPLSPSDISSLRALAECAGERCTVSSDTMEAIFNAALEYESAELLTIYGYYTINKRADFHKGLELFTRALALDPREPQRWKNLINLLIVMQRFDDAARQLETFRTTDTYGNTSRDYLSLRQDLDSVRAAYPSGTGDLPGKQPAP